MYVREDIRAGQALTVTEGSARRVHTVTVKEIPLTSADPLFDALEVLPAIGQPHPRRPDIQLIEIDLRPLVPGEMRATLTYDSPSAAGGGASDALGAETFSVSAQTISEDTIHDARGVVLQTTYVLRTVTSQFDVFTETADQVHRVSVERPTFALRFTRVEPRDAFDVARLFNAHTNSVPFLSLPAKTVLMRISSDEIDDGRHRVTYDAVYNPRTWMAEIRTSIDGRVPSDVASVRTSDGLPRTGAMTGGGIALRNVYPEADFSVLTLRRPPR